MVETVRKERKKKMFKLKKAIEKYLDVKLKELRLKDKKEMTPEELQLINSIEEMERNKRK